MRAPEPSWIALAAAAIVALAVPGFALYPRDVVVTLPPREKVPNVVFATVTTNEMMRPLFSAPAPVPGADIADAPPRLVGIVSRPRGRSVVLAVTRAGETQPLVPGNTADGWTLTAIGRADATFRSGPRTERVTLDLSNAALARGTAPSPDAGTSTTTAALAPSSMP